MPPTAASTARPVLPEASSSLAELWEKHGEAVTTLLCAIFVGAGWLAHRGGVGVRWTSAIFLVGYVLGGYRQAIEGTTTLFKDRALDVDLLMVVAAIVPRSLVTGSTARFSSSFSRSAERSKGTPAHARSATSRR